MTVKKHYIEGDGNGGVRISNSMIGLVSVMLVLIGGLVSTVLAFSDVSNKVDNMQAYFEEAGPRHDETINGIESNIHANNDMIQENENTNAILKANSESIKESVEEIKQQIKELNCKCD